MSLAALDNDDLPELLARSGARVDAAGLTALVEGVAAAPPGSDPDAWISLVAARPDPALVRWLRALLAVARQRPAAAGLAPAERLARLRQELTARRLVGFVVPRADEHQGEQVAAHSERLAWISGFTGSAGAAVVLRDRAALFVDGRYTTQAYRQVDPALWEIRHMLDAPMGDWLADHLPRRSRLGYDPWLHTPVQVAALERDCRRAGSRAVAVDDNPVDQLWQDRPAAPVAPVFAHPERFAGRAAADKLAEIAAVLVGAGQDAAVVSAPDAIAWLFNIRGGDIPYVPVALAFAVIAADATATLFMDPRKLTPGLTDHLGKAVSVAPPKAFGAALDALGAQRRTVRFDRDRVPSWVERRLKAAGARLAYEMGPCILPKAVKNPVELDGMRAAHRRDGAAVTRFLAWLATHAAAGGITESVAADRLEAFRRRGEYFQGLSFSTISAAAANGAVVHYRVTPETDRLLPPGSLYLVDSGGQYLDGTTDVTRTVAIGEPDAEMRDRYTRVLKGHVAIAAAVFPKGTSGTQLDALARQALWAAGLDYDHGTGHGVGSFLNVHEGPQRISKLPNTVALQPGMVVSNEPGYYKEGAYGIRIENLVAVIEAPAPDGAERPLMGFETLTLAPLDRRLIERALLTPGETAWIDAYHARVRNALTPMLDAATAAWLADATRPLGG